MEAQPDALATQRQAAQRDAETLIDRLQAESESHREALARIIHDDLGGLMVSAAMDLTAVRQRFDQTDISVLQQLDRGKAALEAAIDLSRRMVEDLRPSILENFGLFAALKWQFKKASADSTATLTETYPSAEPDFHPTARTALFRVAQEALGMMFGRGNIKNAGISFQIEPGKMLMRFADDGVPNIVNGSEVGAASALTSMKHRVRLLGGTVDMERSDAEGTVLTACIPYSDLDQTE